MNVSDVPDHLLKQQAELPSTPPATPPPQPKRNAKPVSAAAKASARSPSATLLPQPKKNTEPVLAAVKASVRSSSAMSLPQPKRNAEPVLAAAKAPVRSSPVISPPQPKKNAKFASTVARASEKPLPIKSLNISLIGAAFFTALVKKKAHWIFAASMRDIEKALQDKPIIDSATVLPSEYHEYLNVFSKKAADTLSPHQPYDHTISVKPEKSPLFDPLIEMSQDELKVLKKYLEKHLFKGFIHASSSPAAAPVLFVKKPEELLSATLDQGDIELTQQSQDIL